MFPVGWMHKPTFSFVVLCTLFTIWMTGDFAVAAVLSGGSVCAFSVSTVGGADL